MKHPHTKLLDSHGLQRSATRVPRKQVPVMSLILYMSREDRDLVMKAVGESGVAQQSATVGTYSGRAVAAICRAWLADRSDV